MRLILMRFICSKFGHRRGRLTGLTKDAQDKVISRTIKCPRCEETWSRKPKEAN